MYSSELYHHGVLGMKWGRRRYQNKDGSLTPAGQKRYGTNAQKVSAKRADYNSARIRLEDATANRKAANAVYNKSFNRAYNRAGDAYSLSKHRRQLNDERWQEALNRAEKANAADKEYKQAKSDYKQAKKAYKTERNKTNENYRENAFDKYLLNDAGKERINRYLNEGDTLKSARTKTYAQAGINGALGVLAVYGAYKYNLL